MGAAAQWLATLPGWRWARRRLRAGAEEGAPGRRPRRVRDPVRRSSSADAWLASGNTGGAASSSSDAAHRSEWTEGMILNLFQALPLRVRHEHESPQSGWLDERWNRRQGLMVCNSTSRVDNRSPVDVRAPRRTAFEVAADSGYSRQPPGGRVLVQRMRRPCSTHLLRRTACVIRVRHRAVPRPPVNREQPLPGARHGGPQGSRPSFRGATQPWRKRKGIEPSDPSLARGSIGFEDRGQHQSSTRFRGGPYTGGQRWRSPWEEIVGRNRTVPGPGVAAFRQHAGRAAYCSRVMDLAKRPVQGGGGGDRRGRRARPDPTFGLLDDGFSRSRSTSGR